MKHRHRRHRTIARLKKKLGYVAAAVAGAAILSGASLPGVQSAIVHAAADPNAGNAPVTVSQQVTKTDQASGPVQINLEKGTAQATAPQHVNNIKLTANHAQQKIEKKQSANQSASQKAPSNYQQVLDIKATAYAPGPHDNDQWGNKTYTGEQIRPGIIAVDPNVIPLGSRVYIQYPDGHGEYAIAADTGGAIKGNRIDVAKWTVGEAQDFGVQNVKVFIVDTPKNA